MVKTYCTRTSLCLCSSLRCACIKRIESFRDSTHSLYSSTYPPCTRTVEYPFVLWLIVNHHAKPTPINNLFCPSSPTTIQTHKSHNLVPTPSNFFYLAYSFASSSLRLNKVKQLNCHVSIAPLQFFLPVA